MNPVPVYVLDAIRSPIVRSHGCLRDFDTAALLRPLLLELIARNGLRASDIDEVIVGNAAGPGGNPARVALLQAGLPVSIPGVTVDRQCGSGLEAIVQGARLLQSGAADVVLAGGVESVSTAPLRALRPPVSAADAANQDNLRFYARARFAPDAIGDPDMGQAAENVARVYGISRERQDRLALRSHQLASMAEQQGVFARERLAYQIAPGTGAAIRQPQSLQQISMDDCVRADCSLTGLAKLAPVFSDNGTVTAGNACPVNDGAAMVVMVRDRQLLPAAGALEFVDATAAGVSPSLLGMGPVAATRKLMNRVDTRLHAVDAIEFNEAFASQVLACTDLLSIDPERMNRFGGAIAQGHAWGASGAVLVTRLLHTLQAGECGIATLGIGGGLGLSALFAHT